MKSSIFSYPYERVFRRTKDALRRLGMKIVKSDAIAGSIKAVSGFSLTKPNYTFDLMIEEMENHNTRITITGMVVKNRFYMKKVNAETSEAEILGNLSTIF
jgi:hypothetical protein